ncbi:hypothetical protein ACSS6W_003958 [Trichoderma asperelloides]|uniref:Uncharacterized protein n=1 Tax=Trichoderma asperellum TaxID=101201 RepID=A0A6V8QNI4_TRIAP|nr:hypothetical protein LI328DRAFT_131751 [Trichoderma asperelloides]GFP52053.1 hypothetical protein TASIC1_0001020500 [Trichoderma asperellum]
MPVQVYTSSPINATKATEITPKTQQPEGEGPHARPPPPTTSLGSPTAYPPAQPGARPSLPIQTGAPQPSSTYKPSSTQEANSSPPPPQPGAVPSPPGGNSHLPPPPKAGETLQQAQPVPMPPQMSYQLPTTVHPTQGGSSTSTSTAYSPSVPHPRLVQVSEPDFSHPPGYQQNVNAAEFNRDQREAYNASFNQESYLAHEAESVWNTAKKWATAAGDSIAAAENEVWKRINKE